MAWTWSIIGIAFAAFCVWLTVRIINRREAWAILALAVALIAGCSTALDVYVKMTYLRPPMVELPLKVPADSADEKAPENIAVEKTD